jgi:hypothetical protein
MDFPARTAAPSGLLERVGIFYLWHPHFGYRAQDPPVLPRRRAVTRTHCWPFFISGKSVRETNRNPILLFQLLIQLLLLRLDTRAF